MHCSRQICACARPGSWAGRAGVSVPADLHGAGQPVQGRPGAWLETDDEVVEAEPFVRADRAGQVVGRPGSVSSQSMPAVRRSVAGSRRSACSAAPMRASRWSGRPDQAVHPAPRTAPSRRSSSTREPSAQTARAATPSTDTPSTSSTAPGQQRRWPRSQALRLNGPRTPEIAPGFLRMRMFAEDPVVSHDCACNGV
jgi:hypothetical protein